MPEQNKYVEIQYNIANIQILCITNVYYSNINLHKTYIRSDRSDQKINHSFLSQIGPIPTIYKWFLLHTRE